MITAFDGTVPEPALRQRDLAVRAGILESGGRAVFGSEQDDILAESTYHAFLTNIAYPWPLALPQFIRKTARDQ